MTKKYFFIGCMVLLTEAGIAQNIGISNNGGIPHNSAILDVQSSTKGFLMPRTSSITRKSIVSPATGLLLYDTTTSSFWHYNGILWLEHRDSLQYDWHLNNNTVTNSVTPAAIGINTGSPVSTLHLNNTAAGADNFLILQNNATGTTAADGFWMGQPAGSSAFHLINKEVKDIKFAINLSEKLSVSPGGISIGNAGGPTSPLNFSGGFGQKINLYNSFTNAFYGIGIQNNALQIHQDIAASRIEIGYGKSGANFNRIVQINGSGTVDINGKLTRPLKTGDADLLPLAFGRVSSDGDIVSYAGPSALITKDITIGPEGCFRIKLLTENLVAEPNRYMVFISPFSIAASSDETDGLTTKTAIDETGDIIIWVGNFHVPFINQTFNCGFEIPTCSLITPNVRFEGERSGFSFIIYKK
jgi:hypothetical protein